MVHSSAAEGDNNTALIATRMPGSEETVTRCTGMASAEVAETSSTARVSSRRMGSPFSQRWMRGTVSDGPPRVKTEIVPRWIEERGRDGVRTRIQLGHNSGGLT